MAKKLQNDSCEIETQFVERGLSIHYYDVRLVSGVWPSDKELIVACDSGKLGGEDRTFGGKVRGITTTQRRVEVYVD